MGVNRDAMAVRDASAGQDFKTATMAVPSGYMRTEEGVIPRDWELKRIGEIATVFSGGTPNRKTPEYWGGDVPWITTTLIAGGEIRQANEFITVTGVEESSAKWCKAGTILMAMYGQGKTRGKVAILGFDATINQACAAIELKDSNSSEYVLHVLNYMYEDIRELSNSGGQENLSGGIIKRIRLPFPTEPEQRAIAKALSDVDALLEGLDRLIAKKRDLKKAAMQQLLTGQTRLPGFEQDWVSVRLGELGKTYGGLTGKTKADFGAGEAFYVPFVNVMENVVIDCDAFERVRLEPGEPQNLVKSGDLLFNGSSETPEEVAMCALMDAEYSNLYLNSFCFGFRLHEQAQVSSLFLAYYIRSHEGRELIKSLAQGSTRYNLSKSALLRASITIPSFEEQCGIAAVLSDLDAELEALEERHAKTFELKQAMMQELLTGRTRLVEPEKEEAAC